MTRVAAYALVREDGRLLMCRLTNGRWTLPGGGLEFGERPEEGAVREVREETGFDVRLTGLVAVDSEAFDSPGGRMHGIRIVYRAEIVGGELRAEVGGTTDQARFFAPEEARALPLVTLAEFGLRLAFP